MNKQCDLCDKKTEVECIKVLLDGELHDTWYLCEKCLALFALKMNKKDSIYEPYIPRELKFKSVSND